MQTRRGGPGWVDRALDRLGLARQVLVAQLLVLAVVLAVGGLAVTLVLDRVADDGARGLVLAQARSVAADPAVLAALATPDPTVTLQPLAERVRGAADTAFVVVMSTDGERWTHPDVTRIGERFLGTTAPAVAGGEVVETFTGTLGPSVRAVVPVRDDGQVVALVSVGVAVDRVDAAWRDVLPVLMTGLTVALALAALGSWAIARRLRRQTFGMGAPDLARVYQHHDAVLHAIREGLLVLDPDDRVVLVNDEAARLLDLPATSVGPGAAGVALRAGDLPGQVLAVLAADGPVRDELVAVGERVVVVSRTPTQVSGRGIGSVVTLRDRTELTGVTDELGTTRSLADAMHAQAHEAANRVHAIVTMIELGDVAGAVRFATEREGSVTGLADRLSARIADPAVVALLIGKTAQAREGGCRLVVSADSSLSPVTASALPSSDLVTVVGNLVDNALEAVAGQPAPRRVDVQLDDTSTPGLLVVQVHDNGPGLDEEALRRVTEVGWSTRPGGDRSYGRGVGMALVRQVAACHDGELETGNDEGAVMTVRLPVRARTEQVPR